MRDLGLPLLMVLAMGARRCGIDWGLSARSVSSCMSSASSSWLLSLPQGCSPSVLPHCNSPLALRGLHTV
eukprot:scaffold89553_cov17-Tisochrysis_lutea.AAC.1